MHPGRSASRRGAGAGREAVQEADAKRGHQRPLLGAADGTQRRPQGDAEVIMLIRHPAERQQRSSVHRCTCGALTRIHLWCDSRCS